MSQMELLQLVEDAILLGAAVYGLYTFHRIRKSLEALVVVAASGVTNTHTDLAQRIAKAAASVDRKREATESPRPRAVIHLPRSLFPAKE